MARSVIGIPSLGTVTPGSRPRRGTVVGERPGIVIFHHVVARARCALRSGAVGDGDDSAAIPNQSELLQMVCSNRDRRALGAEHLSEEVLCEGEPVRADTVVGHEEPAGAPSADGVTLIAGEDLRDVADHRPGVTL